MPRIERRLAAILAADIVGYSRLVEKDEAVTLATIKRLRETIIDPLLAEHHGRIVKLMGDKRFLANVALVEATTGRQVWGQRYDRPLDDLFAVQDDLAQQIAMTLGGAAERARFDATRKKSPRSLDAIDLQQLGNEQLDLDTAEGNAKVIDLLRQAVELQPENSYTRTWLAAAYRQQVDEDLAPRAEAMASWLDEATTAVRLDPQNGWAHYMLAQRHLYDNDLTRWSAELQRASELGQRNVALMAEMGAIDLPQAGQTDRGVELVERAVRLDQLNIDSYRWAQRNAYFFARRHDEAAAAAEAIGEPTRWGKLFNALFYAQLGRDAEVERWRTSLLAEDPEVSAERVLWWGGDFLLPQAAAERALLVESIEKAGLPRCATAEQLEREPAMRRTAECNAERAGAAASRT